MVARRKVNNKIKKRVAISQGQRALAPRKPNAPISRAVSTRPNQAPRIRNIGKNVLVSHRERFAIVQGNTVGFNVTPYTITPDNSGMFPWLSSIARRFETYNFKSLSFEYVTRTSTLATGSVIMAVDFDATDPPPPTSERMENYDDAMNIVPHMNGFLHTKPACLHKRKTYYVSEGQDASRSNAVGTLFVATEDVVASALIPGASSSVGILYAIYTIELSTPQMGLDDVEYGGVLSVQNSNTSYFFGGATTEDNIVSPPPPNSINNPQRVFSDDHPGIDLRTNSTFTAPLDPGVASGEYILKEDGWCNFTICVDSDPTFGGVTQTNATWDMEFWNEASQLWTTLVVGIASGKVLDFDIGASVVQLVTATTSRYMQSFAIKTAGKLIIRFTPATLAAVYNGWRLLTTAMPLRWDKGTTAIGTLP